MFANLLRALKFLFYIIITLPRDIQASYKITKIKRKVRMIERKNYTVSDMFQQWVKKDPNKVAYMYEDTKWTFSQVDLYGNKIANLFADRFGLKKGDCVALFMENRPEYIAIWYGLSKLGVITALINTNLKSKVLLHSIEVAKPKLVIYDEELEEKIFEVKDEIKYDLIRHGTSKQVKDGLKNIHSLNKMLDNASDLFSPKEKVNGKDILMYIYTSGTTGLPKPAIIRHDRFIIGSFSFFDAAGLTPNDVFYITLPIYHSNGGVIGVGSVLISGATGVLRKKFSASQFWKDTIKYECTCFSYVGEVCRYLINQPTSDLDRQHKVRVCIGNGMRDNIQREFLSRFNVRCVEIYGATEGNCILVNTVGKFGACGFIPLINKFLHILQVYIIRIDENKNIVRDENGFCVECDFGEKGLIVGVIGSSSKDQYNGYANNREASDNKIINDLFKKNQRAFNSGDIGVKDWEGYIYFVDRLGDTFRWKGENVSTIEVENIISSRLDSLEVIVYGVQIPNHEGRAGMAILTRTNVDLDKLAQHLKDDLPAYAKPIFIRLKEAVEHTGSFKAQKNQLVEEGYNVTLFKDPIFYFDAKAQKYLPLDKTIYDKINNGSIHF